MTPDDFARLDAAVAQQHGRVLGACIPVMPGQLLELLRLARLGRDAEAAAALTATTPTGNPTA